jgi:threonine dehydratase
MSGTHALAPQPDAPPSPVCFADVQAAADRIRGIAHRTPLSTSRAIDAMAGARVVLKCENLQRVGAFKFRGAYNALSRLDGEKRACGVVAYSSGNHAQAVALAGRLLGVPTVIVMPTDAPPVKIAATRGYLDPAHARSRVVLYDRETTSREELGARLAADEGLTVIPPYDHPDVIAGQGTAAMELFEDARAMGVELSQLFVCVGGGGLLSGCAIAARAMAPGCRVIGVEPALADDAARSFRTRTLHTVHNPATIADGARTPSLGRWTFPLVLAHVDDIITVTDDELIAAMRVAWERCKLVVEPTGALGLAGVLRMARERPGAFGGAAVGVVISGGNADLAALAGLFS